MECVHIIFRRVIDFIDPNALRTIQTCRVSLTSESDRLPQSLDCELNIIYFASSLNGPSFPVQSNGHSCLWGGGLMGYNYGSEAAHTRYVL